MQRKKILILSYSDLRNDPRVRRQIITLLPYYEIYEAGFKPSGIEGTTYFRLDFDWHHLSQPTLIRKFISMLIICRRVILNEFLKLFEQNYFDYTRKQFIKSLNSYSFDLIISNDIETLPLAVKLKKHDTKLIYDAHEYAPLEFEENRQWMKTHHLMNEYFSKKYMAKADACFTVGKIIADAYHRLAGVLPMVMTNASDYRERLQPQQINPDKIKLVHHGKAIPGRKIEEMILMMNYLGQRFELHFYINGVAQFIDELKQLAAKADNIYFHDVVPADVLPETLNQYDIGVYILAPTNYNNLNALPNKFFEFVQARLAVAIGPSPEMALLIDAYDVGVVAQEFTAASLAAKINALDAAKIMHYKNQSHKHAYQLSSEINKKLLLDTVNHLMG